MTISRINRNLITNTLCFKPVTNYPQNLSTTVATKSDVDVIEFCRQERLDLVNSADDTLIVNSKFLIRFGKPNFNTYLSNFSNLYKDK